MGKICKSSKNILNELSEFLNEWDECELENLEEVANVFRKDLKKVYIDVSDGLLVIPYGYAYDNETYTVYEVLYLELAFLAKDKPEDILDIIKTQEELVSLLKDSLK